MLKFSLRIALIIVADITINMSSKSILVMRMCINESHMHVNIEQAAFGSASGDAEGRQRYW
jgi:hypothetical protein